MIRQRRTKIVATVGPASSSKEALLALVEAGVDVFRLNFSHGTFAEHGGVIERIRTVSGSRDIAILQDLAGPKLRLDRKIEGEAGDIVELTLPDGVAPGDPVLLGDGVMLLEVVGDDRARVVTGGCVAAGKGINLPSSALQLPALTDEDREALAFGVDHGVDMVALSFVTRAADLVDVKKAGVPVIAKIERAGAIGHIEEILHAADGIMVARGDLGVEIPFEQVPIVQKRIIELANRNAKPVITATQMLLSMVHSRMPTRAEVADVANAALDGTDAVMLSEETAVGDNPVAAVQAMDRILSEVQPLILPKDTRPAGAARLIAAAACDTAAAIGAKAVVVATRSGASARRVASRRPDMPVLALSANARVRRSLALLWGIHAVPVDSDFSPTDLDSFRSELLATNLVGPGDSVVVTGGWSGDDEGATNLIHVATL